VTVGRTTEISVARAREEARNIIHEMRQGNNPNSSKKIANEHDASSIRLQALLDQHVFSLGLRKCEYSVDRYPKMLGLHVKDWLNCHVTSITRERVIERHREIGKNAGTRTANAVFRALRALYNLYRVDFPEFQNPVEILSLKKLWFPEKPRDTRIKPHELKLWAETVCTQVKNPVHRDYLIFLLLNGLRKNEAMQLEWSQVDFVGRSFRIEKTKNKKPLELPLTDLTEAILRRLYSIRDTENPTTSKWVFPSQQSKLGHLAEVRKSIEAVNKHASLNIHLHDLRRTFVSSANSIKIPHYTIKKLVNHSAAGDVTASVYNVMDIDDLRESMQQISDYFRKFIVSNTEGDPKVICLTLSSFAKSY
jgi:integrase